MLTFVVDRSAVNMLKEYSLFISELDELLKDALKQCLNESQFVGFLIDSIRKLSFSELDSIWARFLSVLLRIDGERYKIFNSFVLVFSLYEVMIGSESRFAVCSVVWIGGTLFKLMST
jgi:hypothetical protein